MQLGEVTKAEGWEKVKVATHNVLFRKNVFCFFDIAELDPVKLFVADDKTHVAISSTKKVPTQEEIEETWNSFKGMLGDFNGKPLYAVYDFGYYANDTYRSSIVLISCIPNKARNIVKMVYSTNVQAIKDQLQIPFLLQTHSIEEIIFEKIKELVSRIQIS